MSDDRLSDRMAAMKTAAAGIALMVLGAASGTGLALLLARNESFANQRVRYGAWTQAKDTTALDDPLTIARLARFGPFPVHPREVTYLTALEDSAGKPLEAARRYQVCGKRFEARFWSITAYDGNGMFFPNELQRFSRNYRNLEFDGEHFCVHTGPKKQERNWLPTGMSGGMRLSIRLYQASDAQRAALSAATLPEIRAAEP